MEFLVHIDPKNEEELIHLSSLIRSGFDICNMSFGVDPHDTNKEQVSIRFIKKMTNNCNHSK